MPLPFLLPPVYTAQLLAELRQIQQTSLQDDYALERVRYLSHSIGHRLSGSAQAEAAVDYVADELRKLGLEVRKEPVSVPHWVRGEERAELTSWPGQTPGTVKPLVLSTLGGSPATPPGGLSAPVVVVTSFPELEKTDVKGKIVLFNNLWDEKLPSMDAYGAHVQYRATGPAQAEKRGAVAVLVRSWGKAAYRLAHTGNTRPAGIPSAALAVEDADTLAWLTQQGPVTLHLTLTPQKLPDAPSYNVVADLKGTEHPEQIVIVSGHLDSWDVGQGALDDAVGVGMAMQTAAVFQRLHLRPRRTLRVVAWMNEENGLAGGRTYARDHASDQHVGAIEADFGAGHCTGWDVQGDAGLLTLLAPLADAVKLGLTPVKHTGADTSPLAAQGVPCFSLTVDGSTYFDYHHTQADTFDKVDPAHLRENCAAMATLAWALTQLP